MSKNILILLGHPARDRISFCEALAQAYAEGARSAGHHVELIKIAQLDFDPVLHEGYKGDQPPEADISAVQEQMRLADHWVIVYPLWQFMIPALLKGFFERTLTKGFAYEFSSGTTIASRPLQGKSARLIQTMGMPGFVYRFYYRQHGTKAVQCMLRMIGLHKIGLTYCGMAESANETVRADYVKKVYALGKAAQ